MIIKSYEIKKKNIDNFNFFLLHGKNTGLINETIKIDLKPKLSKNVYNYDETEILKNPDYFQESILNKSFFENDKLIIISRATDKISTLVNEMIDFNTKEISVILISDSLEKKSKLRNMFEKNENAICIPFYEDNNLILRQIAINFLNKRNIKISQQNINLVIERCSGDRINLTNELHKIESFSLQKKTITTDELLKITNLAENYDHTNLVNSSLAKNQKKTVNILNENNLSGEDCILILRIYLNKLKRLLKIFIEREVNNNLDTIIAKHKPPIFWKEKEILKQQINVLNFQKVRNLMIKTNEVELMVKKNPAISVNLVTNFILEQSSEISN